MESKIYWKASFINISTDIIGSSLNILNKIAVLFTFVSDRKNGPGMPMSQPTWTRKTEQKKKFFKNLLQSANW
jgi:hypothetical protein